MSGEEEKKMRFWVTLKEEREIGRREKRKQLRKEMGRGQNEGRLGRERNAKA